MLKNLIKTHLIKTHLIKTQFFRIKISHKNFKKIKTFYEIFYKLKKTVKNKITDNSHFLLSINYWAGIKIDLYNIYS